MTQFAHMLFKYLIKKKPLVLLNFTTCLQSERLVLCCPSSRNDSNSLMQMVCVSLGPCWDHQPGLCDHSLAPGRGGPQMEESVE